MCSPGGNRTHTSCRTPEFESGAAAMFRHRARDLEKVGSDPVPGTDHWSHQSRNRRPKPTRGIEPRDEETSLCPCPPSRAPRADDGHRTRDIHFGRVTLCQLSYIRIRPGLFCPTGPLGSRVDGWRYISRLSMPPRASHPVLTPEESASQVGADWWSVAALRPRTQYPAPPAGTCAVYSTARLAAYAPGVSNPAPPD